MAPIPSSRPTPFHVAPLALLALLLPVQAGASVASPTQDEEVDELPARLEKAGDDVSELWLVVKWLQNAGRRSDARGVCAKIIEVDPEDLEARKWLGHQKYGDQWFESFSAMSSFKREEDKRMLEEKGLVRHGDGWAKPEDIPFLDMGWEKGDDGEWASKRALEKRALEAQYAEEGWTMQADLVWVPPDEVGNWEQGLWKCGDEWLDTEKANAYHADPSRPWTLPGTDFIVSSTLPMDWVAWAKWYADLTAPDLLRAYGMRPAERPWVEVLASLAQYNALAGANPPPEQDGLSSAHYAFFAESWFQPTPSGPEYKGRGVCYWEVGNEALAGFGQHAVRHAAAQSFAEAIDPSWNTVGAWTRNPTNSTAAFWSEKRIPRWFRYGVASYVERYFIDTTVGEDGSPRWAREWALENLRRQGGLRPVAEVFPFSLSVASPDQAANTSKLFNEAGVIVMYVLDGGNEDVTNAHRAFTRALERGDDTKEAVEALEAALVANEDGLRRFAQL